jgi:putative hemolysin
VMAMQAADDGTVTPQERAMILNSLSIGRRTAREIMVPRVKVAALDLTKSMDENRRVIDAHLYSRLPLCDGGLDNIVGIVHVKEFLSAYNESGDTSVLSLIAKPPVYMPETIRLDRLLSTFQETKAKLIFLVDEYGGVEGIVTLSDVLDELVGDVPEPQPSPRQSPPERPDEK